VFILSLLLSALAPKKPQAEPILKKKVASIEKVADLLDDIFEEAASESLYSEGSWDESEASSELLAELEALELDEVAEIDEWVSGFYGDSLT